jgi:response regulator RpfG family c-di-GMP phosphodiesterase
MADQQGVLTRTAVIVDGMGYDSMITLLTTFLRTQGIEALGATTTKEGLELVAMAKPDLIFMNPSVLDGIHDGGVVLLQRLKADPVHCRIPVIIITARADKYLEDLCIQLGVVNYINMGELHLADLADKIRQIPG